MLNLTNVSFSYKGNKSVINNINFSINNKNGIYVLLGLNGSGKTTLLKLLAGINKPSLGTIDINGKDLQKMSIFNRSKNISYVAQKSNNNLDFLVRDYIMFANVNNLKIHQSPSKEFLEKVYEIAKEFGVYNLLNKKMNHLSGGQYQMVSICKAIVQDTSLILLDEPTSALDIKNQHIVLTQLKKIVQEKGKTIILTTHNPNHALYLDSNILLMKNGTIHNNNISNKNISLEILKEIYGENLCYSKELKYEEISFK